MRRSRSSRCSPRGSARPRELARRAARARRRARARGLVDRHARAARDPRAVRRRDHVGRVGAHVLQPRARGRRRAGGVRARAAVRARRSRRASSSSPRASLACGLAPSFDVLVGARCVQAVGAALLVDGRARSPLAGRRAATSAALRVWVAAGVLGAALGPAVGGILTQLLGWESIFLAQVPVALVLLLALRGRAMPDRRRRRPGGRRSAANAALLLVAGGLVAALFLVVLLLVDGWGMSPAAAGSSSPSCR